MYLWSYDLMKIIIFSLKKQNKLILNVEELNKIIIGI